MTVKTIWLPIPYLKTCILPGKRNPGRYLAVDAEPIDVESFTTTEAPAIIRTGTSTLDVSYRVGGGRLWRPIMHHSRNGSNVPCTLDNAKKLIELSIKNANYQLAQHGYRQTEFDSLFLKADVFRERSLIDETVEFGSIKSPRRMDDAGDVAHARTRAHISGKIAVIGNVVHHEAPSPLLVVNKRLSRNEFQWELELKERYLDDHRPGSVMEFENLIWALPIHRREVARKILQEDSKGEGGERRFLLELAPEVEANGPPDLGASAEILACADALVNTVAYNIVHCEDEIVDAFLAARGAVKAGDADVVETCMDRLGDAIESRPISEDSSGRFQVRLQFGRYRMRETLTRGHRDTLAIASAF